MSSTFAKIVKDQRVDQKYPRNRAFIAQALLTLAERARTGTLRGPIKLTLWQRVRRFVHRLARRRVV